jgi:hypothetical protein
MKKQRKPKIYTVNGVELTREDLAKELRTFTNMKQRCYNPKNARYSFYGGRGLRLSDRWMDPENGFINFVTDMGRVPSQRHSIDRINNDLGYSKENCRWILLSEQSGNKKNYQGKHSHIKEYNKIYTHNGVSKTVDQWFMDERIEERLGITVKGFNDRIGDEWHHDDIINVPAYGRRKHKRSRLFDVKNDRVLERKPRESKKDKETA